MLQGFENVDIADPAFGLIAAICLAAVLTATAIRSNAKARKAPNPLSGLFTPDRFEAEIEATERRVSPFSPRGAVLQGKIDHIAQVRALWGPEVRQDVISQVAQVMRAGVRKGDCVTATEGPEGDASFVILAPGASEDEASGIAKRLLRDIGQAKVSGMGKGMRLTASFGVASRRLGENEREWHARARAALDAAQTYGEDQILTASDWEEVVLLPAPSASGGKDAEAA